MVFHLKKADANVDILSLKSHKYKRGGDEIVTFANYFSIKFLNTSSSHNLPLGALALILSKHYYGVLSKSLENLDIDRYYSVLFYLSTHNGCSQQDICNSLAIDKTAMVKVMEYLIKAGYVHRSVNPDDRREFFIILTAKGKKQTSTIVKAFGVIDDEVFKGSTKAEKALFYKMTDRLISTLKDLPSNDLFFNYKKTRTGKASSGASLKK
jgi:DNA-binding MarR family transcriptional regulator